jgi:hypothetical protein
MADACGHTNPAGMIGEAFQLEEGFHRQLDGLLRFAHGVGEVLRRDQGLDRMDAELCPSQVVDRERRGVRHRAARS